MVPALQPRLRYEVKWQIFTHLKIFAHWTWAWTDYAIWLDKNIIRKPRSFHLTHISAYIHMRQNQLTSPVPFSRTNTENQRESILFSGFHQTVYCMLTMLTILTMLTFPSTLHVYFVDPAIHYFVNINRWIPSSLPCWNSFSLDIMRMSPSFRKKCPWLLTKWISLTFFANADWSMGEAIFSFASSSLPNSKTFYFGRKWFFRNKRNIVVLSLLSGQGLIDGSVFLPLPLSYLWLSTRFYFWWKRIQLRENLPCFFGRKPRRGWRWCEVSCKKRLPLLQPHFYLATTCTAMRSLYCYFSSDPPDICNFMEWNLEMERYYKGQFATIIMFCCDFFLTN